MTTPFSKGDLVAHVGLNRVVKFYLAIAGRAIISYNRMMIVCPVSDLMELTDSDKQRVSKDYAYLKEANDAIDETFLDNMQSELEGK